MTGRTVAQALSAFLHYLAEYAPVFSSDEFAIALELARRLHSRLRGAPRSGGDDDVDLSVIDSLLS